MKLAILLCLYNFVFLVPIYSIASIDYTIDKGGFVNTNNNLSNGDYLVEISVGQNFSTDSSYKSLDYIAKSGFYNPPHFQFQRLTPVNFNSQEIGIQWSSNSVSLETFDLYYNKDIDKSLFENATKKLSDITGGEVASARFFSFAFFDDYSFVTQLNKEGSITTKIVDSDADGYVDGTKLKFSTLAGYKYNEKYDLWVKASNFDVSFYPNYAMVGFNTNSGGVFSIFASIDNSVKDVYAFPVPFRPNGPKSGNCVGCSGTDEDGITFVNIPDKGYIEIYTIDGRLVKKITLDGSPLIKWNTKNESGEKVVSGVYIWRVVSENYTIGFKNSKTGKLVIIR